MTKAGKMMVGFMAIPSVFYVPLMTRWTAPIGSRWKTAVATIHAVDDAHQRK
jgi:hypothetical protein